MLADELIASEQLRVGLGGRDHDAFSNALHCAQRFSLSREFAAAATQISHTNISSFSNCMIACRVPAPVCWFEVPDDFRSDIVEADSSRPKELRSHRTGVLIESKNDSCTEYEISRAYKLADGKFVVSITSNVVSLDGFTNEGRRRASREFSYVTERDNSDAAVLMESRIGVSYCRFTSGAKYWLSAMPREEQKATIEDENFEWNIEIFFWLSALALLNTRNAGSTIPQNISRLNKARVRSGKKPLLAYSVCTIDAAKTSTSSGRGHASKGEIRAHFMRGHFKLRKTGVFWWRPSMRGNLGAGAVTKSYSVRHTGKRAA